MKYYLKVFIASLVICPLNLLASYYTNDGTDQIVDALLRNKKGGVFIDIGAADGITNNRTYFFEKECGWVGACIETNNVLYEKLRASRLAVCVNASVGSTPLPFLKIINDNYNEQWIDRLSKPLQAYDPLELKEILKLVYNKRGRIELVDTPSFNFADLMQAFGLSKIDFLSIGNVENKVDLLRHINFQHFDVDVLVIENAENNYDIQKTLVNNGFVLLKKLATDEIYRNAKYAPI
jgi:hypothetical protein